jgi:HD-GYP domain-containing protein (c-di-GMP phosphodiesterase class II)
MKSIKISDLKVGTEFSKPLYLDKDSVFINAHTKITQGDIDRLTKFGFKEVLTIGELIENKFDIQLDTNFGMSNSEAEFKTIQLKTSYIQIQKAVPTFEEIFKETFSLVQGYYRKIADDKPIEFNSIRELAEKIVDHVKQNPHLAYCIISHKMEGYYLYNQVLYSAFLANLIGQLADYSKPKLIELAIASLLADIGMAKIPSVISEKNASLTEEEFKVIKKHPLFGYQIITKVMKLKNSLGLVSLQHHENFDGTGYPQKTSKKDIDETARIFTVADTFSAFILDRPWRKATLPYDAMKSMISTNNHKYDLTYVRLFLNKIAMYPTGSWVELSDSRKAIVIEANNQKPLRPSIMIVKDQNSNKLREPIFINLPDDEKVFITKAIPSENI